MYIYLYIHTAYESRSESRTRAAPELDRASATERSAEYAWKPHPDLLAQQKPVTGPSLLVYA